MRAAGFGANPAYAGAAYLLQELVLLKLQVPTCFRSVQPLCGSLLRQLQQGPCTTRWVLC